MIITRVIGSLLGSLPNRRPVSHNDRERIAVPSGRRCRPFIGANLQSRRRGRAFRATDSARTAPVQQTSNLGFRYFLCESFCIRIHWRLGRGPLSPRLSGRATWNCARSWACDRRHDHRYGGVSLLRDQLHREQALADTVHAAVFAGSATRPGGY